MTQSSSALPRRFLDTVQYSFLALPLAFASLPLYIHAPDFYAADLGMSLAVMGVILAVVRFFDAVQDPFIGYVSDRYAAHRLSVMSLGMLMLMAGFIMLFLTPMAGVPVAVWFALSMVLATSGFSVVSINLNMIGGFWQNSPQQRTRISSWREGLTLLGLLIAAALPEFLKQFFDPADAYQILVVVFAVLAVLAFMLFVRFMMRFKRAAFATIGDGNYAGWAFFRVLFGRDGAFFGVSFLTHLAAAFPGVLVLFFIRDYLGAEDLSGIFLLCYFLTGALGMVAWVYLSDRVGAYRAWFISMIVAVMTFMWAAFLGAGDVWQYGLICALSGLALGADLALPPAIVAGRVERAKDQAAATQYYAILTFLPKVALALAAGIAFLVLDRIGFKAASENDAQALFGLLMVYAVVPCVIKVCSAGALWLMITKEKLHHE